MLNFNERYFLYETFYSGSSYSAAYNSYNFCDRSKPFAVVNCKLLTFMVMVLLSKIHIKSLSNESIKNKILIL